MKKRLMALVLTCAMTLGFASCANSGNGKTVTVGITQEPTTFDPHTVVAAGDKEVIFNVYEGLYKFDANGNLVPCLATDVEVSDDCDIYTFTIRENVKFHNDADLTPADVAYSLNRAAGLLPDQDGTALVSELDGIASVTVSEDNKVVVSLEAPDSEIKSYLTVGIIPEGTTDSSSSPVGTGPFKFESYTIGQDVTLVKNDSYWMEPAKIDKVVFKIVADLDAGLLELQNGNIDVFPHMTKDKADQLNPDEFSIKTNGSNMVQIFALNNSVEPLNDIRVRKAINFAVSRPDLISMSMDGAGVELVAPMSPAMGSYYDTSVDGMYAQDVEKAKALLKEAGYENGFDLEITVPSDYLVHVNTAIELASELKAVGINATVNQVDWGTWLSETYTNRNYQSTVICLTSNFAPYDVIQRYKSDNPDNFINYSNSEVDKLIASLPGNSDDSAKVDVYHQILKLMTEDAASCYIQDPTEMVAVKNTLDGYNVYPMYVQDMYTVYFK